MAQGEQSSSATDRTLTKPRRRTGADNPRLGHGSEDFTQFTVRNAEVTVQDPCVPKKKRKRVSMCSGTFLGSRIPLIQWQGQPAGGFAGPSNKPLLRSSSTAHSSKIQLSQLSTHTHNLHLETFVYCHTAAMLSSPPNRKLGVLKALV